MDLGKVYAGAARKQGEVFADGEVGQEDRIRDCDDGAGGLCVAGGGTVDGDSALEWGNFAAQGLQQRRFTRTIGTLQAVYATGVEGAIQAP